MLKKTALILLSALIILSTVALCIWLPRDRVVLLVDDTKITESEFLMIFENEVRGKILSLASEENNSNPYESEYNGTTLGQLALTETCKKVYEYVAWQQLFREYEVYDWSWKDYGKAYKEKQNNAYNTDEIQYGTQSYTKYDYYVYLHSIYRLQVIEKMKSDDDADAIHDFYLSHGDDFRETDIYVFDRYSVDKTEQNAQQLINDAADGKVAENVDYSKVTLDAYSSKYEEGTGILVDLGEKIYEMNQNGSEAFSENETELLFFRTVSYQQGDIKPYEDCKESVSNRFYDEKFVIEVNDILNTQNTQTTKQFDKIKLY